MKTFYIFEIMAGGSSDKASDLTLQVTTTGSLKGARDRIDSMPDGRYLVLEDTSGEIVKSTETITKTRVKFDAPRKKTKRATSEPVAKKAKGSRKPAAQPESEA